MMRTFLWKGTTEAGYAKVARKDVCLPLEEGGQGIRNVQALNYAIMSKHLWEIIRRRLTSIWIALIHQYRLQDHSIWTVSPQTGSWAWRKLLRLHHVLQTCVEYRIGDGRSILLWCDPWHTLGPLLHRFSWGPQIIGTMMDDYLDTVIVDGANIIFGKLLRNQSGKRERGTPPPRSLRGTPSSSESKGKRPASASASPGIALSGSSKKSCMSSLSTPPLSSTKPPSRLPPPPALKDETGVPLKYSRAPSDCLQSLQSLDVEPEGNFSLVGHLMRGVLSSSDRQLLAPLSQEELEGIASSFLLKGTPSMPQSEAQWQKLEDKVDHLNTDMAKLKEEKKEVVTRNQQ
ncbi:UNVERIFIED_CONTAM: hypothetical protein Slati_3725700 [Sesamum latifolium]|uniref:Uncharacterized protein n=1 Tax=Sesamum latifolium TaxID=2727402 RepID=A0AAW2U4D6_9LAMI